MQIKPHSTPVEGSDYLLVPDPSDDQAFAVRVASGLFEGILYKYDRLKVREIDEDDGGAVVEFNVLLIEGDIDQAVQLEFNQLTTDILHSIFAEMAYKEEYGNETGHTNSSQSGQE